MDKRNKVRPVVAGQGPAVGRYEKSRPAMPGELRFNYTTEVRPSYDGAVLHSILTIRERSYAY